MNKQLLFLTSLLISGIILAQLPANEFFRYEFTNGSLANTAQTTATDLTGTAPATTTDRNTTANAAIDVSCQLVGANLGTTNLFNTTLSFWMKRSSLNSNERVLQMYGTSNDGYRVEIDGSDLYINASFSNSSSFSGGFVNATVDVDDNNWHHIVVRTSINGTSNAINFDLFIDGVAVTLSSPSLALGTTITNFLSNASFRIDPLNGTYGGSIDDIYFYKTNLTNAEVADLYAYSPIPLPTRYYVDADATGNNDGTSWTNAFTDLQNAFANSYKGMEIWVADGTYKRQTTMRNTAFNWSVDSLKVYGGFDGSETLLNERDWLINRTILSGDIGTNGDMSDNSYAVFVGPFGSNTNVLNYGLLDGFVIQDGNANANQGLVFGSTGAAVFLTDYVKKMDLNNCEISNNNAKYSAIFALSDVTDVTLNINNCIVKSNAGRIGQAITVSSHGQNMLLNVKNSLFTNNESKDMGSLGLGLGGVIYLQAQNTSNTGMQGNFTNCTFANNPNNGTNTANFKTTLLYYDAAAGGGSKHVQVDNCIFWGNNNDTISVGKNPNGSDYQSVTINNTLSEFPGFETNAVTSNIVNSDPQFISNSDFSLQNTSPAINTGTQLNLTIPSLDLAGNPRVSGNEIDLGCYEFQGMATPSYLNENELPKITAFPNPTNGRINLISDQKILKIEIYNLMGKRVMSSFNQSVLDLSALPNGVYLGKFFTKDNSIIKTNIIKQ